MHGNTVFVSSLPHDLLAKDIWAYFRKGGKVRDIILPRKKDIYNNRIGFIVTENSIEASSVIRAFNGKLLSSSKLYLSMARNKEKGSVPPPLAGKTSSFKSSGSYISRKKQFPQSTCKMDTSSPGSIMGNASAKQDSSHKHDPEAEMVRLKIEVNESFIEELKCSIELQSVNVESPEMVSAILEGLGYKEVIVICLSNRSFIAHFSYESDLSNVDLDFLSIAFNKVQQVEWQNLSLVRRTWVECRGLPMVAWKEENFEKILSAFGKVVSYAPFLDEDGFYTTPRIQIETKAILNISSVVQCEILGTLFKCGIVECGAQSNDYQEDK